MGKKIYESKYTAKKVTAAQYVAERMTERLAISKGQKLSNTFWYEKEWANFFKYQNLLANKLIKLYNEAALIAAISDKSVKKVYSLNLPVIATLTEKYYHSIEQSSDKEELTERQEPIKQRQEVKKQNLLDLI